MAAKYKLILEITNNSTSNDEGQTSPNQIHEWRRVNTMLQNFIEFRLCYRKQNKSQAMI
jgi:hypothetical protein